MARPRRKPTELTECHVKVVMTPSEKAKVERKAEASGESVTSFCRRAILGRPAPARRRSKPETVEAIGHLGPLGNNLNQILRVLNEARSQDALYVKEDVVRDLEERYRELKEQVDRIAQHISMHGLPEIDEDTEHEEAEETVS